MEVDDETVHLYGELYQGLYTLPTAGQKNYAGITPAAKTRWNELVQLAEAGREDVKRDQERVLLAKYKAEKKILADTYEEELRRKRRKTNTGDAAGVEDEEEDDEDADFDY